ncbi:aldehyde dehydrogenase family protein [Burkholderia lata]|uniref:Aldehyde dehydrogenase n=2 Tax=Burkholderia lata (strain ATCC 17760 / DSM 23089 / LMG 22485 / NCIMB 9086 / R18194 / 383) TaxID=482957 RepID=A0A6P2IQV8_BURL3|nr:aldehyde dehydrogenase family protein [Burkholderia lata]ABB06386.1 Aldehyde dehydrogenase [Burkholderia lata]VWB33382.1 aldehyde dehydrogenase [Burkholderia lata]
MLSLVSHLDHLNVRPGRLFIDGQWLDWPDARFDQLNPCTNEVMTSFADAGAQGVELAVAAARKAFDEGPWPRMRAQDRKRLLQPIVERLYAAEEEIARLQTLDNGIPYAFSRHSRVSAKSAADVFDHFLGWIDKINGDTLPIFSGASNMQYMTFRDPVGVVAAVLPYNGPVLTFAMKVAPALACGCTVIVKSSELTNLAVARLAQIIADSDLPPGVFNFVTGGVETGSALTSHAGVDKVTFTGSPAVGEKIMIASAPTMKRLSLELGGKSAALVFPDTRSVQTTAHALMGLCSTFLSGQVCSTPSRAVVHRSIMDEFLHHAQEQLQKVRFGDPFDAATTSAPMISRRHQARVLDYVESGRQQGATLLAGGRAPGGEFRNGNWVEPALFANVSNDMTIAQEEIFGPVLSVIPFDTEEEAIRIANDSAYGLAGCVYTTDVSRAFRVARAVKSGAIGVNGFASIPNAPFGGIKRSGTGREGGWSTIEAFTELKTVNFNLDA